MATNDVHMPSSSSQDVLEWDKLMCSHHTVEICDLFCLTCLRLCCSFCMGDAHLGHQVETCHEAWEKLSSSQSDVLKQIKADKKAMSYQIKLLKTRNSWIVENTQEEAKVLSQGYAAVGEIVTKHADQCSNQLRQLSRSQKLKCFDLLEGLKSISDAIAVDSANITKDESEINAYYRLRAIYSAISLELSPSPTVDPDNFTSTQFDYSKTKIRNALQSSITVDEWGIDLERSSVNADWDMAYSTESESVVYITPRNSLAACIPGFPGFDIRFECESPDMCVWSVDRIGSVQKLSYTLLDDIGDLVLHVTHEGRHICDSPFAVVPKTKSGRHRRLTVQKLGNLRNISKRVPSLSIARNRN